MPYITPEQRERIVNQSRIPPMSDAGQLSFFIAKTIESYLKGRPRINFQELNAVNGVLDTLRAEYQRQVLAPYEDKKKASNGDVWEELRK